METTTTSSTAGASQGDESAASKAQATAADAASKAQEAAGQMAGKAQEAAGQVAEQATEQVHKVAGQGQDRVRGEVDKRSTDFGERATGTADDLRSISGQLREQGNDQPAQLADQIADQVERFGRYLRDTDSDALLRDVERAARQRPWAVIAGGVAAGFFASRLLKASSSDRYRQHGSTGSAGTSTGSAGLASTGSAGTSTGSAGLASTGSTGTRAGAPGAGKSAGTPLEGLATHAERIPGAQPAAGGATTPTPTTGQTASGAIPGGPQSRGAETEQSTSTPEGSVHGEHRA